MANGGITGAKNIPTRQVASGTWGTNELLYFMQQDSWPSGNLGVEVGSFTSSASTGNQDITITTNLTTAPAGSWAVIFWTTYSRNDSGVWDVLPIAGVGFAASGGGSISQYAVGSSATDGSATSDTQRRIAAACIAIPHPNSGSPDQASFVGFQTATAMRINWTDRNYSGSNKINYMIISGIAGAKVVSWSKATGVGSKSVIGAGFSPDIVLHATARGATAIPSSSAEAGLMFGCMNRHGQQWVNSFYSQDGVSPTNSSRWQQTDACIAVSDISENTPTQAHFQSMDADGFSVYFANAGNWGGDHQFISLCLSGVSSKIGAYSANVINGTQAQTIASRQEFVPKGIIMSNNTWPASGVPNVAAAWSLGATDLTNSRAVSLRDNDGVSPTNAKAVWFNDKLNSTADSVPVARTTVAYASTDQSSFSVNHTSASTSDNGNEFLYILLGASGVSTFPSIIDTTNSASNTSYSNQKKAVELSTGRKVFVSGDGTTAYFYWSDAGGASVSTGKWMNYSGANIAGWSNGSIDAYLDSGGTERLVAAWKQSGTGGGRTDGFQYVMVGTFGPDRSTLVWDTANARILGNDATDNYPDVVAHPEGAGGYLHAVRSRSGGGPNNAAFYCGWSINSSGLIATLTTATSTLWSYTGSSTHTYPSIDYDPATRRLFAAYSAGLTGAGFGIRFRTVPYATWSTGGAMSWASEVEVDGSHYASNADFASVCRWDGSRVVIGGHLFTGAASKIVLWDSSTFSSFTNRVNYTPNTTTETYGTGNIAVDSNTGDVYIFGRRYSSGYHDARYYKATRAGLNLTLSPVVVVDSFIGGSIAGDGAVNAFPVTGGIGWVYTHGNNAPYSVKYDRLQLT